MPAFVKVQDSELFDEFVAAAHYLEIIVRNWPRETQTKIVELFAEKLGFQATLVDMEKNDG
jgi:hypothetical protein